MILTVVLSVDKFMMSRSGDYGVIVGIAWYLGYLITGVLVLISVKVF